MSQLKLWSAAAADAHSARSINEHVKEALVQYKHVDCRKSRTVVASVLVLQPSNAIVVSIKGQHQRSLILDSEGQEFFVGIHSYQEQFLELLGNRVRLEMTFNGTLVQNDGFLCWGTVSLPSQTQYLGVLYMTDASDKFSMPDGLFPDFTAISDPLPDQSSNVFKQISRLIARSIPRFLHSI